MRKADNLPPSCAVVTKSGRLNLPAMGLINLHLPFNSCEETEYKNIFSINFDLSLLLHRAFRRITLIINQQLHLYKCFNVKFYVSAFVG